MKFLLAFIVSFLFIAVAKATSKCPTSVRSKVRDSMVKNFRSKDYEAFASDYATYCKENSAKITCKTEKVKSSSAEARTMESAQGHPCVEIFNVGSKESKTAMLYIIDQK